MNWQIQHIPTAIIYIRPTRGFKSTQPARAGSQLADLAFVPDFIPVSNQYAVAGSWLKDLQFLTDG